ncbi:hypothetical protein P3T76_011536 [Phytophthora citrophthora]|uniref:Uncharacterized protein n=1 Tax=Phytophthora citrophthora TaxID=4793 RepID=A0AAD9G8D2_9STRA|nr:hypothetical protein P3T76_011536 [Phytophthora citrophthora]
MEHFRDGQAEEILSLNADIASLRSGMGTASGGTAIAILQGQQSQHTAEHWDSRQQLARIQARLDAALDDRDNRLTELREAGEAEIELQQKLHDRERELVEVRHDLMFAQNSLVRWQRADPPQVRRLRHRRKTIWLQLLRRKPS